MAAAAVTAAVTVARAAAVAEGVEDADEAPTVAEEAQGRKRTLGPEVLKEVARVEACIESEAVAGSKRRWTEEEAAEQQKRQQQQGEEGGGELWRRRRLMHDVQRRVAVFMEAQGGPTAAGTSTLW